MFRHAIAIAPARPDATGVAMSRVPAMPMRHLLHDSRMRMRRRA